MIDKSAIFATTNNQCRRYTRPVSRYVAFLLSIISNADIAALCYPVNGSQSVYPCIGSWSRRFRSAVFLFLAYHEGKYIHKPHNDQHNA